MGFLFLKDNFQIVLQAHTSGLRYRLKFWNWLVCLREPLFPLSHASRPACYSVEVCQSIRRFHLKRFPLCLPCGCIKYTGHSGIHSGFGRLCLVPWKTHTIVVSSVDIPVGYSPQSLNIIFPLETHSQLAFLSHPTLRA